MTQEEMINQIAQKVMGHLSDSNTVIDWKYAALYGLIIISVAATHYKKWMPLIGKIFGKVGSDDSSNQLLNLEKGVIKLATNTELMQEYLNAEVDRIFNSIDTLKTTLEAQMNEIKESIRVSILEAKATRELVIRHDERINTIEREVKELRNK